MRRLAAAALIAGAVLTTSGSMAGAACNIIGGKAYGDCSNVRVNREQPQKINVKSYVVESGIISGATVLNGGTLALHGISNGDVLVHKGGRAIVGGTVNGSIYNRGGYVEVEGIVDHLHLEGGVAVIEGVVGQTSGVGEARYKVGSVLNGVPFDAEVTNSGDQ
jgi:hypothetical protein